MVRDGRERSMLGVGWVGVGEGGSLKEKVLQAIE